MGFWTPNIQVNIIGWVGTCEIQVNIQVNIIGWVGNLEELAAGDFSFWAWAEEEVTII